MLVMWCRWQFLLMIERRPSYICHQHRLSYPRTLACLKSGVRKIRTFAFLRKKTCPENPGFYNLADQVILKKLRFSRMSKKFGLSPKVTIHVSPDFKQATVFKVSLETLLSLAIVHITLVRSKRSISAIDRKV